tara:strand:+ start:258 stop:401 length:144 start_codon:yes stop_codon:yes gene_type:complete
MNVPFENIDYRTAEDPSEPPDREAEISGRWEWENEIKEERAFRRMRP